MTDFELAIAIMLAITIPAFIVFEIWYFRRRKHR